MELKSQSSPFQCMSMEHKFNVTRLEIQPYVEQKMVFDYGSQALHAEICRNLKQMITDSLTEMKPPKPKIEIKSYSYTMVFEASVQHHLEGSRKKGRPITTILIKELETSFKVPHNCIAHQLDMDTIALVYRTKAYQKEGKMMCAPQFSFQERLEGWYIETRQRLTSICDTFYHHARANRSFRSILEVVKFLLYEVYPNCNRSSKNKQLMVQPNNNIQDTHLTIMPPPPPMINVDTKLRLGSNSHMMNEDEEEEKYYKMLVDKFFDEDTDEMMNQGEDETLENMLESMYNGLHSISINKNKTLLLMITYTEGFVFALFNENLKPDGVEQNFGLFYPNMQPVYSLFPISD